MADLTMCEGDGCPDKLRLSCYRHLAPANDFWQSRFTETPYNHTSGKCSYYEPHEILEKDLKTHKERKMEKLNYEKFQEKADKHGIPDYMQRGLYDYLNSRLMPSDFLLAVFKNDLFKAAAKADSLNKTRLANYVTFLYNEAPMESYGSEKAVYFWLNPNLRGMD